MPTQVGEWLVIAGKEEEEAKFKHRKVQRSKFEPVPPSDLIFGS